MSNEKNNEYPTKDEVMRQQIGEAFKKEPQNNVSIEHIKKIQNLKEIELPDEWYSTDMSEKLPERWNIIAKKIKDKKQEDKTEDEIVSSLIAKYMNDGLPFKHTICFNHLFLCDICRHSEGVCIINVVSLEKNLFVSIEAEEIHMIISHGGKFSDDKLKILEQIFN